jgi:arginine-tRNA-protein transferase
METAFRFHTPEHACGYLPEETARLEYAVLKELTPREYLQRMLDGWRRFGFSLFRPQCPLCNKCQPIRIVVDEFRPNRSQRRVRKLNEGVMKLRIGRPRCTAAKLKLYDRYHAYQSSAKDWPFHGLKDVTSYRDSFIHNPFPTQEWCYYLDEKLVGVGYVDDVPGGLSAIYFFYDPEHRDRSPGIWNVLQVVERAAERGVSHVYLGYYVAGCRSMEYKATFVPNEVRHPNGEWCAFRSG